MSENLLRSRDQLDDLYQAGALPSDEKGYMDQRYLELLDEHQRGGEAIADKLSDILVAEAAKDPVAAQTIAKTVEKAQAATQQQAPQPEQQMAPDTTAALPQGQAPESLPTPELRAPDPQQAANWAAQNIPQQAGAPESQQEAPPQEAPPWASQNLPMNDQKKAAFKAAQGITRSSPSPSQEAIPPAPPELEQQMAPTAQTAARANQAIGETQQMTGAAMKGAANDQNPQGVLAASAQGDAQTAALEDQILKATGRRSAYYDQAGAASGQAANKLAQQAVETASTLKQYRDAEQAKADEFESARKSLDTLNIDPNHFWGTRTTEQKLMASIGIALSTLGGGTKAMDVINDAIKQDIEVQKANAELRWKGLEARKTVFDMYHSITGDVETAANLAQKSLIDQAQLRIQQATMGAQSEEAKINGMNVYTELELKKRELDQKIFGGGNLAALMARGGITFPGQQNQVAAVQAQQGSPQGVTPQGQLHPLAQVLLGKINRLNLDDKTLKRYAPQAGLAWSKEDADKIKLMTPEVQNINSYMNQLQDLIKKHGVESNDNPTTDLGRALATKINQAYHRMTGSKRDLSSNAQEVMDDIIPENPLGGFFRSSNLGKIPYLSAALTKATGNSVPQLLELARKNLNAEYANELATRLQVREPETNALLNAIGPMNLDNELAKRKYQLAQ